MEEMREMQEELVTSMVAEVEAPADIFAAQIAEMDRRIREMEAAIGDLRTVASTPLPVAASSAAGRKTLPTHTAQLLAKQGVALDASGGMDVVALDAALTSLSVEQRIAVKSQMLRAGLLG